MPDCNPKKEINGLGNSSKGPPSAGRRVTGASGSWQVSPGALFWVHFGHWLIKPHPFLHMFFSPKHIKAYHNLMFTIKENF